MEYGTSKLIFNWGRVIFTFLMEYGTSSFNLSCGCDSITYKKMEPDDVPLDETRWCAFQKENAKRKVDEMKLDQCQHTLMDVFIVDVHCASLLTN